MILPSVCHLQGKGCGLRAIITTEDTEVHGGLKIFNIIIMCLSVLTLCFSVFSVVLCILNHRWPRMATDSTQIDSASSRIYSVFLCVLCGSLHYKPQIATDGHRFSTD